MSKKRQPKTAPDIISAPAENGNVAVPVAFGYEDMLSELEAIVAEAEIRLIQETELA
ncbi:hypothetical protein [Trabulsiella odontotermitis]|uniref:hypothetical protein n=1 Tax=Trabulsiella odontotermitis TaxID=379893 RepID=UPI0013BE8C93|nr:hypothetical protein [Trabulsiella odontotermitis]